MPQQQRRPGRHRGLLAASMVSTGAIALVVLNAPPAQAAAPRPCPKGTDPASTIENWKCQLDNIRRNFEPEQPTPTPAPSPTKTAQPPSSKPGASKPKPKASKRGSGSARSGSRSARRAVPQPPPVPVPHTAVSRPYPADDAPEIPGALPAPEIAADPHTATGPATPTRLTAPAAASRRQGSPMTLWVAAAAGAAGAVGALNISVLGRTLRHTRARGRA